MPYADKEIGRTKDRERYLSQREEWLRRSNARHNRIREAIRQEVSAHLAEHPCLDCGESDPIVLDFDHVRGVKAFGISYACNNLVSIERLREEIAKCEIRCANCHRRKTHQERRHRPK